MSTLLQPLGASTPLVREPCWRSSAHALLFHPSSSPRASSLHLATNAVILLSTACFVAESFVAWHHWGGWTVINGAVCLLFTGEYALRLFLVPYGKGDEMAPPRRPSASARLHFMRQPLSIVDALSVAPFWLEIAISPLGSLPPLAFLQLLRALRLVRVLRLLRLAEECTELAALARCAASTLPLLRLLLLFLALEAVTLGGLAFHAESWELDETGELWLAAGGMGEASDFQNILDAMWWTVVTVSTVGYGDMCPRTFLGRVLACIAMLTGVVGLSALVSILGAEMAAAKANTSPSRVSYKLPHPMDTSTPKPAAAPPICLETAANSAPLENTAKSRSHEPATDPHQLETPGSSSETAAAIREHCAALERLISRAASASHPQTKECIRALHASSSGSLEALAQLFETR